MFQDGGIGLSNGTARHPRAYNTLAREARMNARGYLHFMSNIMDEMLERGTWNLPVSTYLYYGGVKSFADGSIQSLTAVLGEPYACKPDFVGIMCSRPNKSASSSSNTTARASRSPFTPTAMRPSNSYCKALRRR